MTLAPGLCLPLVSLSFCGQRPDAATPAPGSVPACLPVFARSDARCCDSGSGVVSPACLPVSPSLYGQMPDALDARCCDAGSQMLPLCRLSSSLCDRMPDAVTLAPGSCLPQFLRSEARCCDAGSGVVSPTCLPVSRSLCDAATLAPGCVSWPQLRARLPPRVISVLIPAIKLRSADDVNFRAAVGASYVCSKRLSS